MMKTGCEWHKQALHQEEAYRAIEEKEQRSSQFRGCRAIKHARQLYFFDFLSPGGGTKRTPLKSGYLQGISPVRRL